VTVTPLAKRLPPVTRNIHKESVKVKYSGQNQTGFSKAKLCAVIASGALAPRSNDGVWQGNRIWVLYPLILATAAALRGVREYSKKISVNSRRLTDSRIRNRRFGHLRFLIRLPYGVWLGF
jgi:hypothetical protein